MGDLTLALAGNLVADSGVALDLARGQAGRIDLVLDDGRAIAGGGTLGLRTQNVSGGETALDLSGQLSGDVALAVLGGGRAAPPMSRCAMGGPRCGGGVALTSDAGGDSVTTVTSGALIDGAVVLGGLGDDDLSVAGGADLSQVSLLNGGGDAFGVDGWDALILEDVSQGGFLAEALTGWEEISLAGDTVLGIGAGGDWQAGHVDIGVDAALACWGGQVELAGGLTLGGQVGLQNGAATDRLTVGGDFTGGGTVFVDVDFTNATADRLSIAGDVLPGDAPPTILAVQDISTGEANGAAVLLVDIDGTTREGDFVLAGGPIYKGGAFGYDLQLTEAGGTGCLPKGFRSCPRRSKQRHRSCAGSAFCRRLPCVRMRGYACLRMVGLRAGCA